MLAAWELVGAVLCGDAVGEAKVVTAAGCRGVGVAMVPVGRGVNVVGT